MASKLNVCGALGALTLLAACSGEPETDAAAGPAAETGEGPAPQATPAAAPAASAPPAAFATCVSCHSVEPGKHGIGPSMHGVFGEKAASVEGFNYSPALKNAGLTWDRATLDEWLTAPVKMVPGTRMVMSIPNPEARAAIIDYLETLK